MSNVTHYVSHALARYSLCQDIPHLSTRSRSAATCKRCLAALAKADRDFRLKSRRSLNGPSTSSPRPRSAYARGEAVS